MAAIIPTNPSPQLKTALTWVEGLNKWDLDLMLSADAEDYKHYTLPSSLGIPPRSKPEFKEYFTTVLPMFTEFTMKILEIVESPGKVALHALSTAKSTTGFPYENEYVLILNFTTGADGVPKISVLKEFLDSKYSLEFITAEIERQKAKAQA